MTIRVAVALALMASVTAFAQEAGTPARIRVGASVATFVPLGQELRDTYTLGLGAGVELGLTLDSWLRLVTVATPTYSSGTPQTGPLAADAGARLWSLPVSLSAQLTPRSRHKYRPYLGTGVTVVYVNERLKFASGIGKREDSQLRTSAGFHGLLGLEQNRSRGLFAELWLIYARAGAIDDGTLARSLGGLQFRLGYRGLW